MNYRQKFDIQLRQGHANEAHLRHVFETGTFDKIECKDETWQWRRTGNICVEYRWNGKPSGIADTDADHWVHTLHNDDGSVLVHLVFPTEQLLTLARWYWQHGGCRKGGGDGGLSDMVVIPLAKLFERKWDGD